jgi:hypothetical protein
MNIIEWLENHFLPCAYKQLFGIECPLCGSQRALIELLRGNIIESIKLYPALIPSILIVVSAVIQLLVRWRYGWKIIRILLIADFVLIMISYIIKLVFFN